MFQYVSGSAVNGHATLQATTYTPIITAEPEISSNVQFVAEQFRAPVPNLAIDDGAILWQAVQLDISV